MRRTREQKHALQGFAESQPASWTPARSATAIAARLIATRESLGLSQAELCRRTGIATNTYNQWEAGKRPSLDEAIKLCEAFGLTLDWIYRGIPAGLPYEIAIRLRDFPSAVGHAKNGDPHAA